MVEELAGAADRWLAMLAGRNTWEDAEHDVDPTTRALSVLEAVGLTTAVAAVLSVAVLHPTPGSGWLSTASVVLVVATPVALVGPVRAAFGSVSNSRSVVVNVLTRAAIGILLAAGVVALAPGWWGLVSWPIGITLGCDVALTANAIGWRPRSADWWTAIVLSPFHLGVIGGLIGATLRAPGAVVDDALPIYLMLHLWLLVAWATASVSRLAIVRQRRLVDTTRADTLRDEHRRSAHWLHDDICAQLRLVALRVQGGQISLDEVADLIDEVDFALRLRQLDELIESGSVRLAEVLQPFLRNAQNVGVEVARVPSYDVASIELTPETAVTFRRAAAVLTSNALNAGARTLWFDVAVHPGSIELVVSDDAGGFDASEVTAGRGLWTLRHDLGPDHLTIERTDEGSSIRAVVTNTPREMSWPT